MVLRLKALLAIYAIIPLCGCAWAIDRAFFSGALRDALPSNPEKLFLYSLFFGWPHILASNVILVTNRDYLRAYGKRALVASFVIAAFFIGGNFVLPPIALSLVAAIATVAHVVKQQVGIGRGAARAVNGFYAVWGWTGIAASTVTYNAVYVERELADYAPLLDAGSAAFAAVVVILAALSARSIESTLGRAFLWGNTAMVVAPALFHAQGYDAFAIAIPRIIHDTTAFAFYVAHDRNKHGDGDVSANALARVARRLPAGVYWMSPAVGIALAFAVGQWLDPAIEAVIGPELKAKVPITMSLVVFGFFAMLHYYTESFTWKNGSPYRRWVTVRA